MYKRRPPFSGRLWSADCARGPPPRPSTRYKDRVQSDRINEIKKNEIIKERERFKKEIEDKIVAKVTEAGSIALSQRVERDKEFIDKFKQSIVLIGKTNLNGEALFKIPKGQYYIFFVATIAENTIMWNYRIDISTDNQYIELSNDNAYGLDSKIAKEVLDVISRN